MDEEGIPEPANAKGRIRNLKERLLSVRNKLAPRREYRFRPGGKSGLEHTWSENGRTVSIAAVSVVMMFIFYTVAQGVTGYATYTQVLENKLNETRGNLSVVQASYETCTAGLKNTQGSLETCNANVESGGQSLLKCQKDKDSLNSYSNELNDLLNICGTQKTNISAELEKIERDYKRMVISSVRPICCSAFNVIKSGEIKWDIDNNTITCGTGNYVVNCGSGDTNY